MDIGVSASKGVLTDTQGKLIASHGVSHTMSNLQPGFFEHDAEKIWWGDFVEISRKILSISGVDPHEIEGIGTSGISRSVLPVDENHQTLRPAIFYGIDTRSTEEIVFLKKEIGVQNIKDLTGRI